MTNPLDHTTYQAHAATVESAIRAVQNVPGKDYSDAHSRHQREMIAVNVHNGIDPLEGVR